MTESDPAAAVVVVRSEERATAGTRSIPVQRVVLRKVIVSEERTITVTVRHEELRIDSVPVEDDEPVVHPVALPVDLVLHEEQVLVSTRIVPTERVHVGVRQVVEQATRAVTVRSEQVDVSEDPEPRR